MILRGKFPSEDWGSHIEWYPTNLDKQFVRYERGEGCESYLRLTYVNGTSDFHNYYAHHAAMGSFNYASTPWND